VTETLRGSDFQYNFVTQQGSLDTVRLQLVGFDVSAASLTIMDAATRRAMSCYAPVG
jgi:hypothetical protein